MNKELKVWKINYAISQLQLVICDLQATNYTYVPKKRLINNKLRKSIKIIEEVIKG